MASAINGQTKRNPKKICCGSLISKYFKAFIKRFVFAARTLRQRSKVGESGCCPKSNFTLKKSNLAS